MKTSSPRVVLLGVLIVSVVSGCKPPPSKVQFNNSIAEANKAMAKAATTFRSALYPVQGKDFDPDSKDLDMAKLRGAQQNMSKALQAAQAEFADARLPRKSQSAQGLKETYDNYLTVQKEIMDKADRIVAVLSDPKMSKAEKKNQVEKLLAEIKDAEEPAFTKLTTAQKNYMDEHNFKAVANFD